MRIRIVVGCAAFQDGEFTDRLSVANDNSRELGERARAINDMFDWSFADISAGRQETWNADHGDEDGIEPFTSPFVAAEPATILSWPMIPRRTPR